MPLGITISELPLLCTLFRGCAVLLEKALSPMIVTVPSSGITLFLQPRSNVFFFMSIKQLPALRYTGLFSATVICSISPQSSNAPAPIDITVSEMYTFLRLWQSLNASLPMTSTPAGICISCNCSQYANAPSPIRLTDGEITTFFIPQYATS